MKRIFSAFVLFLSGLFFVSFEGNSVYAMEENKEFNEESEHQSLNFSMNTFNHLVIEVEKGLINTEDEAMVRLIELTEMELPELATSRGAAYDMLVKDAETKEVLNTVGALKAAKAKANSLTAISEAKKSGYLGLHNGKGDAFRHALWNALMARDIGASDATKGASLHEKHNPGPQIEHDMDYFNNSQGRSVYTTLVLNKKGTTNANLISEVKTWITNGRMKYINSSGKLVFSNK